MLHVKPVVCLQGNIPAKDLQRRPLEMFMCSVLKRQGYGEGKASLFDYNHCLLECLRVGLRNEGGEGGGGGVLQWVSYISSVRIVSEVCHVAIL